MFSRGGSYLECSRRHREAAAECSRRDWEAAAECSGGLRGCGGCLEDTEATVEWPEGTERLLWTWCVVEDIMRLLWNVAERTDSILECSRRHWETAVECRGARRDAWGQKVAPMAVEAEAASWLLGLGPSCPRLLGLQDGAWGPGGIRLSTSASVGWHPALHAGVGGVVFLRPGLGRARGRQGGVVAGLTRRSP